MPDTVARTQLESTPDSALAQRASRRIARRLLPYLFLLYVIAFLDRMNVGAAALQMPSDLGFSNSVIVFKDELCYIRITRVNTTNFVPDRGDHL